MAAAYVGLDKPQVAHASVLTRTTQQIGGSFGTAVLAVVLERALASHPGHTATGFDIAFRWTTGFTALAVRELEFTEPLADAIWQLGPDERPLSRRDLAERLHCDPSNVTFLVDRLEEKGLAQRATDQHDGRVKAVSLTPDGVAVRQQLAAGAAAAPIFAGLTKVQKQHLTQLLHACLAGAEVPQ